MSNIGILVSDIFDYIFIKCDIMDIHEFLFVCKEWKNIIMAKSIKCNVCNKIIKVYDTVLYISDNYCLMCHGRSIHNESYLAAQYEIQNIKTFQTVINLLNNIAQKLIIYITMDTMIITNIHAFNFCHIYIKFSKVTNNLKLYSFHEDTISFTIKNKNLSYILNKLILLYNATQELNSEVLTFLINTRDTTIKSVTAKINKIIYPIDFNIENCKLAKFIKFSPDASATIDSQLFNKLCMSIPEIFIKIQWHNNKINFMYGDSIKFTCDSTIKTPNNNNSQYNIYKSRDILQFSKFGLSSDNITLHLKLNHGLIFITKIKNFGKIRLSAHNYK